VDFVIQETETDILIDAKGVEMSARGRVTWRPEVVYGATKTSVVKAIMQGMATAKLLQQERTNLGTQVKEKEKFLLIVTYEPFYLGNGSELWTALGSSLLSKLDGEFEQPWPLSPSCCYCITIREFEALLEYCNHHTIGIGSVLQRAKDADSEGKTRRFMLDQHLADQGDQGPYLSRLSAALDQLTKRCGAHLAVQDPPESIT
jgi:hypothetical protein